MFKLSNWWYETLIYITMTNRYNDCEHGALWNKTFCRNNDIITFAFADTPKPVFLLTANDDVIHCVIVSGTIVSIEAWPFSLQR